MTGVTLHFESAGQLQTMGTSSPLQDKQQQKKENKKDPSSR